ncbi:dehydratase [Cephaloticoccus capnophilus]|uniref:Dehydratase n=1 Tax=Cephaloticoccus capnophilus TaxID=1548208 RepID=A0A139SKU7_9BACT|nr:mandelate racemase/muconate lactonizing enzyme family protein [Cephaloticoccus capnophilus]KXU35198.1 dehydratase [Cephaloticoccus capnophilus]
MKITRIDTLQIGEFPFLLWLQVHTDSGLIGTGETFWAPGPVASYIHENVASYLLGKDPRDIELHDRRLASVYVGARDSGAELRGNSAINIALWDLYSQSLGEPLWRLLGGRTHQSVPVYNTCAGYGHVRATGRNALFERTEDWSLKPGDMDEGPYEDLLAWRYDAGGLAKSLLQEGIRAMKIWPFDIAAEASNGARITLRDLDKALEPFAKIRQAVGNEMEIMVEMHGLWTLPPALRIAEALKPFSVAWLEEPIRYNEFDAMAELARHTNIPLAASERLATRQMFKQLIDKRAASIIMIDLAWCGGLSEARKIANMAEASELPVTLHDCTGPVVYAASCALSATLPNVTYQEMVRAYTTGWYREIADNIPEVADGGVSPLPGPGLGLRLKPELFSRPDAIVRTTRL